MAVVDIVMSVVIILILGLITSVVFSGYYYYIPRKDFQGVYTYMIYVFRCFLSGILYNGVNAVVLLLLSIVTIFLYYNQRDIDDGREYTTEEATQYVVPKDTVSVGSARVPNNRPVIRTMSIGNNLSRVRFHDINEIERPIVHERRESNRIETNRHLNAATGYNSGRQTLYIDREGFLYNS